MRSKSQEKHAKIMEAASTLFLQKGYASTSMAEINELAGGSKATLYSHFASKEALFQAVIPFLAEARVEIAFHSLQAEPAVGEALRQFGEDYLSVLLSPDLLNLYRITIAESGNSPVGKLLYENGPRRCRERLAAFFAQCHARGSLHCPAPHLAAVHFLRLIEGDLIELSLLNAHQDDVCTQIAPAVAQGLRVFLAEYATG